MTYAECENLLDAYAQVVLLADNDAVLEWDDVTTRVCKAKDDLGEFICSLLSDGQVGDKGKLGGDAR